MHRASKQKGRHLDFLIPKHPYIPPAATSDPNHHPIHVLSAARLRRAPGGDKLDDVIEKMEAIARIANGISLEIGLIDQTIAADVIIPELLHMGTLTLNDVANVNFTSFKIALMKMEELSTRISRLYRDEYDANFLTRYFALDGAREKFAAIGDTTTLPGKHEYVGKLEQVVTDKLMKTDMGDLDDIKAEMLKVPFKAIYKMKSDTDDTKYDYDLQIMPEKYRFDNVINNMNMTSLEKVNNIAKLKNGVASIKVLLDEQKLNSEVDNGSHLWLHPTYLESHLQPVNDVTTALLASQPFFQNLQTMVTARHYSKKWTFTNSAGFKNGAKDLEKLHNDASGDFVRKVMKYEDNSANLKKAMLPMETFRRDLSGLENDWSLKIRPAELDAVNSLITLQYDDPSYLEDTHAQVLKDYEVCDKQFVKTNTTLDTKALTTANTSLNNLDTKLKDLAELDYQKGLREIKNLKDEVGRVTKADQMKKFVTEWKANDRGAKAVVFLEQLEKNLKVVETLDDAFYTELGNVKTNVNALDGYLTSLATSKHVTLFKCLENVKNHKFGTRKMNVIQKFKSGSGKQDLAEVTGLVSTIENSVENLKKAKRSGEEMKDVTDKEAKVLKESIPKAAEISQKLGLAIQGLQMIRKADEQKSSLTALNDVGSITKFADANLSKLKQTAYSSLQKLDGLGNELQDMFGDITTFREGLTGLKTTSLAENQEIFTAAAAIRSVTVNAAELKDVVEQLAKIDPNLQVDEVINALNVLDNLDLDFASYQFTEAKQSLTDLDTFFAVFHNGFNPVTPSSPRTMSSSFSPNPTARMSQVSGTDSNSDEGVSGYLYAGLIGGLIFGIFAVAAVHVFCYLKTKREQRELVPIDEKPSDDAVFAFLGRTWSTLVYHLKTNDHPFTHTTKLFVMDPSARMNNSNDYERFTVANETRFTGTVRRTEHAVEVEGFDTSFIHANYIVIGGHKYIMCQMPLNGIIGGKIKTKHKFYSMLKQQNVKVVVQLCDFYKKGEEVNASWHFEDPRAVYPNEPYSITTLDRFDLTGRMTYPDKYAGFNLEILDQKTGASHRVDVIRFIGWAEDQAPAEPEHGAELCKIIDSYKGNVVVLSTSGVGRAGTFVAIRKSIELFSQGISDDPGEGITAVRECRLGAVKTEIQALYSLLSAAKGLMITRGISELELYDRVAWAYKMMLSGEDGTAGRPKKKYLTMKEKSELEKKMEVEVARIAEKHLALEMAATMTESKSKTKSGEDQKKKQGGAKGRVDKGGK